MSNAETRKIAEYPEIVSRAEWLNARKELLAMEKELTLHRDAVNAERRRLPMVRIEKDYVFECPKTKQNSCARANLVFHTYSTYARGTDLLAGTYNYLDLTAFGRQENWEAPPGRSDGPFMHWIRHHDRYEDSLKASASCCGVEKEQR